MTAARKAWAAFAFGAGILAATLAMISRETLRLEESEQAAREGALREGRTREVLWRMDTAMESILALEAGRSPEQYMSRSRAVPSELPPGESRTEPVPSPLLTNPIHLNIPPFTRLHFLVGSPGTITSPEIPGEEAWATLHGSPAIQARVNQARQDLALLAKRQSELLLPPPAPAHAYHGPLLSSLDLLGKDGSNPPDYPKRVQRNFLAQSNAAASNGMAAEEPIVAGGEFHGVRVGTFAARWIRDLEGPGTGLALVFVRTVGNSTSTEYRQGFWIDWPRMREYLLDEVVDQFPAGSLDPVTEGAGDPSRMLAAIPARFEPGPSPPAPSGPLWTPARTAIALAWGAVAAAAVLAGLALRGALELGDRRARFASAVTHELRTPLTTFQMYSQMLAGGMVPPGAEKEYLATLQRESERLSRVVESVLLYARLEEGKGGAHRERIGAAALLDRVLPALEKRAAEGGLALAVARELPAEAGLDVDLQAVEQILLNLVDNACKYAAAGKALDLDARVEGRRLRIAVTDHGPGVPAAEAAGIFEPFRRLARDEAGAAPGAGLGLAVARGLARALGGYLVLLPRPGPGAGFLLTLPLAAGPPPT